jgi:phosphoglycolate phosphatase-like HAD superfamily hydrolase
VRGSLGGKTDFQIITEIIVEENLLPEGYTPEELSSSSKEIINAYLPLLVEEINLSPKYALLPGVKALIDELRSLEKAHLGLLTGNVKEGAKIKLDHFAIYDYFATGAFGCDAISRLDLPQFAHQRANHHYGFDFSIEDIIVIGDTVNDINCAKHYGAKSLAVQTGFVSKETLAMHKPDYLFADLSDTRNVIKALIG